MSRGCPDGYAGSRYGRRARRRGNTVVPVVSSLRLASLLSRFELATCRAMPENPRLSNIVEYNSRERQFTRVGKGAGNVRIVKGFRCISVVNRRQACVSLTPVTGVRIPYGAPTLLRRSRFRRPLGYRAPRLFLASALQLFLAIPPLSVAPRRLVSSREARVRNSGRSAVALATPHLGGLSQ